MNPMHVVSPICVLMLVATMRSPNSEDVNGSAPPKAGPSQLRTVLQKYL
jgi:hypothetical protein